MVMKYYDTNNMKCIFFNKYSKRKYGKTSNKKIDITIGVDDKVIKQIIQLYLEIHLTNIQIQRANLEYISGYFQLPMALIQLILTKEGVINEKK